MLQILFVYLAYASDILELLEIFKEKAILEQTELVYGTLLAYTISLLQFVLIFTSVGVTKRARNVNTFIAFVTHRVSVYWCSYDELDLYAQLVMVIDKLCA